MQALMQEVFHIWKKGFSFSSDFIVTIFTLHFYLSLYKQLILPEMIFLLSTKWEV